LLAVEKEYEKSLPGGKFDIIFIDPPYKSKCLINILSNIEENKILSKNGLIIFHQHKREKDLVPENFKLIEKKNYGISKIVFGNFKKI